MNQYAGKLQQEELEKQRQQDAQITVEQQRELYLSVKKAIKAKRPRKPRA